MIVIACLIVTPLMPPYHVDIPPPMSSTPPDPAPAETAEERSHSATLPNPPPCSPLLSTAGPSMLPLRESKEPLWQRR
jgi:hypothetical protein